MRETSAAERSETRLVFLADCPQLALHRTHLERCGYRLTTVLSPECRVLVFCHDHLGRYEAAAAGLDAPKLVVGADPPASWKKAERVDRPVLPLDLERRINRLFRRPGAVTGMAIRLLMVEDDATVRAAAETTFGEMGFEVRSVSGFGGVQGEMRRRPDVVLMDLNLPGVSGEQLGEILRSHGVPIVIFSSAPPERLEAARSSIGAVAAFSKGAPLRGIAVWIQGYFEGLST
ncbi:MAG TPA: hypothetical protein DD490_13615 [Acidobacteria bacterium]|nr:hypothetical protein [Acidobacteriota bacterium]